MPQFFATPQAACRWSLPRHLLHKVIRLAALASMAVASQPVHAQQVNAQSAPRPNVVLVMADDLGFSDLGCYGGEIQDAASRSTGCRRAAFHAVLQHGPLLADAGRAADGILCSGSAA